MHKHIHLTKPRCRRPPGWEVTALQIQSKPPVQEARSRAALESQPGALTPVELTVDDL